MDEHVNRSRLTNRNVGIALCIILSAALAYYLSQDWVFEELRDKFILGLLTLVSIVWMLILSAFMIVDRQRNVVLPELSNIMSPYLLVALVIPIAAYGLFLAALWIGFPIALFVFCSLGVLALGLRPVTSAFVSGAAMTAMIYLMFRAIGERLPLGLLAFGGN